MLAEAPCRGGSLYYAQVFMPHLKETTLLSSDHLRKELWALAAVSRTLWNATNLGFMRKFSYFQKLATKLGLWKTPTDEMAHISGKNPNAVCHFAAFAPVSVAPRRLGCEDSPPVRSCPTGFLEPPCILSSNHEPWPSHTPKALVKTGLMIASESPSLF